MNENITATVEPQVVETTTPEVQTEVIDTATPMDNNTTYDNLTVDEVTPKQDFLQSTVQQAVDYTRESNLDANSGTAMDTFLNKTYDYNKKEAGTYWVAGAINDVNTQMEFLNTLINEEMYDDMELQKYYFDTTMATARAYAAQKKKETAYGYYRAAQEKAIAEAQLTGWYMPAEGNYMLGQYTIAQNILEDPNTSEEDKRKAKRISGTVEKWFNANQITPRGIKCLNMMNYEENVRHNKVMGELQKEANKISGSSSSAQSALAGIQLREFKFQVEELENQYGYNFTKDIGLSDDNYLGHDIANDPEYIKYQSLGGAKNLNELLKNPDYFAAILGARNTQWLKDSLGEENYNNRYNEYRGWTGTNKLADAVKNGSNLLPDDALEKIGYIDSGDKTKANKEVYTFYDMENSKPIGRAYYKDSDGRFIQIKDGDTVLSNGKSIKDVVNNFSKTVITYDGQGINVGNTFNYAEHTGSVTQNVKSYTGYNKKQQKTIKEQEGKGYHVMQGTGGTKGINTNCVMTKEENGETVYYEVEKSGAFHQVEKKHLYQLDVKNNVGEYLTYTNSQGDRFVSRDIVSESDMDGNVKQGTYISHADEVISMSRDIGNGVKEYTNPDNSTVYFAEDNTGHYKIISQEDAANMSGKSKTELVNASRNKLNYSNGYIPGNNVDTNKKTEEKKTTDPLNPVNLSTNKYAVQSKPASVSETKMELESKVAEYEEYVSRLKKEDPKATPLSFNKWSEGRPSINNISYSKVNT